MAIQTVNIGTIANDGTGDDLREAFVKVNANFNELDLRAPERTTGANLGSAGEGVFAQLSGSEMQFKKIIGGTAVTLASDGNAITINSTATGLPAVQVFADNNNFTLNNANTVLTLAGGNLVTTNLNGSTITISAETSLLTDTNPRLGTNLDGNQKEIINTSDIKSNIHGIDIRQMDGVQEFLTLDMGGMATTTLSNTLDYLAHNLVIDFDDGSNTFTESNQPTADMGILT
jgi:hypothetical protein|tara:strand:- start:1401 stop:2093 length:693 start_codon:yes stop_codon:yes gene_type:complete